jgi:exodeoxyribonuclease VII large subunit
MPELIQDKKVYSLLEVTRSIQKTLAERYTSIFWIKADMNKLNLYHQSGHCFPDLVEKKEGRLVAELKATLWRDDYNRINSSFLEVLKEPIKEGITILFSARIQFDPVYGLSLRITDIDPWYSLGELEKEKQLSINRLKQEGIFNQNRNLPFPLLPARIAIISAETSKGYADFMQILNGNHWDYRFFHMLFPAFLQGDKAAPSIINQLNRIKKIARHFDVVAIIRGGGGDVGLTCYNNYELARTIASYPMPVITGIGHSTNETVSEMVAWKNAITPTELADFLLQKFHDFTVPLHEAETSLIQKTKRLIMERKTALVHVAKYLRSVTRGTITGRKNALDYVTKSLMQDSISSVLRQKSLLEQSRRQVSKSAIASIRWHEQSLVTEQNKLLSNRRKFIREQERSLLNIEKIITIMSPEQVLKRGYSITTINGNLLRHPHQVTEGDIIKTTLTDGEIISTVSSSSSI